MARTRLLAPFGVLLVAAAARAEIMPTFHPASCCHNATHIVLVQTRDAGAGKFRVVESWAGDLKPGADLQIPGLARDARGGMVLFLCHDAEDAANPWRPAGIFREWRTSVAWIDGDTVSVVEQEGRGPPEVVPLSYAKSQKEFRALVASYVDNQRALAAARAEKDPDKRVAALAKIVSGASDRREEAFALLGECGPKAVPVLRKVLDGPPSHDHKYAVAALAAAGGREAVVPDIARRIEAEVAWWAAAGPKLETGWWWQTDSEAWKRHGTLLALVDVYPKHPAAALEKQVLAVRDLMRNLPAVDADRGIPSLSARCEKVLKGDGD